MYGDGGIWQISVLSPWFCFEPKIAPKNKVLIKKKEFDHKKWTEFSILGDFKDHK